MAGKYKKCPRCELNYILVEEELCPVCRAELKPKVSDEDDMELCTLCGINLITVDQVMCDECAKKRNLDDVVDEGEETEEESTASDWGEDPPVEDELLNDIEDELVDDLGDGDVDLVNFSDLEELEEEEEINEHFDDDDDFGDIISLKKRK